MLNAIMAAGIYSAVFFLGISKAIVEIGIITSLIAFVLQIARKQIRPCLPSNTTSILLMGFLAWIILGFLIHHDTDTTRIRGLVKWIKYLALFFFSYHFFQNETARQRAIHFFLVSMVLLSLNGFYQLFIGHDLIYHAAMDPGRIARMKSSLGAPSLFAAFFLLAIPLMVEQWLAAQKGKRILSALYCGLFITAFLSTFTRAAFYGLASAIIIVFFRSKLFFKYLIAAAGIGLAAIVLIQPLRFNYLESIHAKDLSLTNRLIYWQNSWDMARAHPVLGIGANQYFRKMPAVQDSEGNNYRGYAHNSYLQIAVETGFVGLALLLAGILSVFSSAHLPISSKALALKVGLIAFLLHAFWDNHFFTLPACVLFWLMLGLFAAMNRPVERADGNR